MKTRLITILVACCLWTIVNAQTNDYIRFRGVYSNTLFVSGMTQYINFNFNLESDWGGTIDSFAFTFPSYVKILDYSSELQNFGVISIKANTISIICNGAESATFKTDISVIFDLYLDIPAYVKKSFPVSLKVSSHDDYEGYYDNDASFEISPITCSSTQIPVTVVINTDEYPSETGWTLTNSTNTKVFFEVSAYDYSYTEYRHEACMYSLDTVKFEITDTWGDGICCYNGYGEFRIETPCGNITEGGMFNDIYDTTFVIGFSGDADYNYTQKTLGYKSDWTKFIFQTCDGGIISFVNDDNKSKGGTDISVVKINAIGDIEWIKKYGANYNDNVINVIETNDGNFLVCGDISIQDNAWSKPYLLKIDTNGDTLWTYTGIEEYDVKNRFYSAIQVNEMYYIIGAKDYTTAYLMSFSIDGTPGNVVDFDFERDYSIFTQKTSDNFILVGANGYSGTGFNLIKINTSGVIQNDFLFNNTLLDGTYNYKLKDLGNDQFAIIGYLETDVYFYRSAFFVDATGDVFKEYIFDNDDFKGIYDMVKLSDGSFSASCFYWDYDNEIYQTSIVKLNSNFVIQWEKPLNITTTGTTNGVGIIQTKDNGYAIGGYFKDAKGLYDFFVAKINSDGVMNTVYQHEEICMVTVDHITGKNMVIWEKTPNVGTESFNVYKETNKSDVYELVANVPFTQESIYLDPTSNSRVVSNRYKITCVNELGKESMLSKAHKTMHLTINRGLNNAYNLIWEGYEGFEFNTYNVYRGTKQDDMVLIASIPNSLTTFTDIQAPSNENLYYQISVVKDYPCSPNAQLKSDSGPFSQSISNLSESELNTEITETNLNIVVNVFPNPADENLNFEISGSFTSCYATLLNAEGKTILEKIITPEKSGSVKGSFDVSLLESGQYFLNINCDGKFEVRPVVVK